GERRESHPRRRAARDERPDTAEQAERPTSRQRYQLAAADRRRSADPSTALGMTARCRANLSAYTRQLMPGGTSCRAPVAPALEAITAGRRPPVDRLSLTATRA